MSQVLSVRCKLMFRMKTIIVTTKNQINISRRSLQPYCIKIRKNPRHNFNVQRLNMTCKSRERYCFDWHLLTIDSYQCDFMYSSAIHLEMPVQFAPSSKNTPAFWSDETTTVSYIAYKELALNVDVHTTPVYGEWFCCTKYTGCSPGIRARMWLKKTPETSTWLFQQTWTWKPYTAPFCGLCHHVHNT